MHKNKNITFIRLYNNLIDFLIKNQKNQDDEMLLELFSTIFWTNHWTNSTWIW